MSDDTQSLTADELTDHLNSQPGSHYAERKSKHTVTVKLEHPGTNIPQRVIGLGWSLYLISDRGCRLVFIPNTCEEADYHTDMNQMEANQ